MSEGEKILFIQEFGIALMQVYLNSKGKFEVKEE